VVGGGVGGPRQRWLRAAVELRPGAARCDVRAPRGATAPRALGSEPDSGSGGGYDARVPRLACRSCGRQIYTVAPLESLFAEERRCPRCGAALNNERRESDRRHGDRRQNPADDPGPPDGVERRIEERRTARRRRGETMWATRGRPQDDSTGWQD